MRRILLPLVGLLLVVALLGPQLAPIGPSGTGVLAGIRRVITCDANAISLASTDPGAAGNSLCAARMIRTLDRSPTASLVRDLR